MRKYQEMETGKMRSLKNPGKRKLSAKILVRYLLSVLIVGLLIFLPAGTMNFRNGWLFMGTLFIPMLYVFIYLLVNDPEYLEKRIKTKEKENVQKFYVLFSTIISLLVFIIPGLDFRFGWSEVPIWVIILAAMVMIAGYFLFFTVMKQNRFASRVVEIQESQKLIDTGLYARVRHPMYLAGSVFFLPVSLVLGSWYGLIPALLLPFLLIIRLKNEEKVLIKGLEGYDEYMKKVKYRLIPGIY